MTVTDETDDDLLAVLGPPVLYPPRAGAVARVALVPLVRGWLKTAPGGGPAIGIAGSLDGRRQPRPRGEGSAGAVGEVCHASVAMKGTDNSAAAATRTPPATCFSLRVECRLSYDCGRWLRPTKRTQKTRVRPGLKIPRAMAEIPIDAKPERRNPQAQLEVMGWELRNGPLGSTATDPPWARQASESSKAFSCFQSYRDHGPLDRSVAKVAEKVGKSVGYCERL